MPGSHLRVLRIVVCSPGDVMTERDLVQRVAMEINGHRANAAGIELKCWRWETDTYPAFHAQGPQGHIDRLMKIEDSDVVIGIFWKRFGTPTMGVGSGTEHELRTAHDAWKTKNRPQVMVYFSRAPYAPRTREETDQWGAVLEFQAQFPKEGLWWHYESPADFERLIRDHLHRLVSEVIAADGAAVESATTETLATPSFADLMSRTRVAEELTRASSEAPIVVFGGLSGTGKTYAVSEFIRTRYGSSTDRHVVWYDAEHGESIDRLLAELGRPLQLMAQSTHSRCKELCTKLRERQSLLVIDNFHSVDEESYRPLIASAARQPPPAILLLITQRASPVLNASAMRHVKATGFSRTEVVDYVAHRGLPSMTDRMAAALFELTDGLPFAVALFSTLVKEFGEDPIDLLSRGLRAEEAITEWFGRIAVLVKGPSLEMLKRLSLLETPFNAGLLKLMTELARIENPESVLRDLQRAYLVQKYSAYRWKTHDLVADRCRELLAPEVRHQVYEALSRHFLRGYPKRKPSDVLAIDEFRWKTRALEQLMRSGDRPDDAAGLFQALVATAKATGRYMFVITTGEALRRALPQRNRWIDYHVAHAYLICGASRRCFEIMDEVLRAEALADANVELACRRLHAEALLAQGLHADARAMLSGALAEAMTGETHASTRAHAAATLAFMDLTVGRPQEAIEAAQRLLADAVKTDSRRGAAVAKSLIGGAMLRIERTADAVMYLQQASELFDQCHDRRGLAWTCAQLAECLLELDDTRAAQSRLLDAAQICSDIGECSADYLALLNRVARKTTDPGIRHIVDAERERISDWESALPVQ